MKVLHLDSSALAEASVSRRLSSEIVGRLRALHPGLQVIYRDLAADPAVHLTGAHVAAFGGAASGEAILSADLMKGSAYLDELFAADVLVVGAPM